MRARHLGCISFSGILFAFLAVLLVAVISLMRGGVLFSPGGLSSKASDQPVGGVRSHAELNGRCSACHSAPWDHLTMTDKCITCHTDVIQDPHNFHRTLQAQNPLASCRSCHTDHRGPDALLTVADITGFPHDQVGFSLKSHQHMPGGVPFACADCHPSGYARFDQAVCDICHIRLDATFSQAHHTAFGSGCLACHDGLDSYGHTFDHNRLPFPLKGKHAALTCEVCHKNTGTLAGLKATPQDCYACHAKDDRHQGQFGQDCAGCHTVEGWSQATFDHSKSAFPLTGAHQRVECKQCHVQNVFKGTSKECFGCHAKDDKHQGQFGQDCAACHTTQTWAQATFDHAKSAFPLTGAHQKVDCAQCHKQNVFKGTPMDCVSCHAEPAFHLGEFGTDCKSCHTTDGWRPAQFNGAHTFPINHGGNGSTNCQVCHPNTFKTYTCYGCHAHDPAGTAAKHQEEGITDIQDCVGCHPSGQGGG